MPTPSPSTPILDSCSRSDENPLAGGWATYGAGFGADQRAPWGRAAACLISNQIRATSPQGGGYWATPFLAQQEAYCDIAAWGGGGDRISLFVCLDPHAADGYRFAASLDTSWHLARIDSGVETILVDNSSSGLAFSGSSMALSVVSGSLTGWMFSGSVWSVCGQVSDDTYVGGYIGFSLDESDTSAIVNFGGGTIALL